MSTFVSARSRIVARAAEQACALLAVSTDCVELVAQARRAVEMHTQTEALNAALQQSAGVLQALAPEAWVGVLNSRASGTAGMAEMRRNAERAVATAQAAMAGASRRVVADAIRDFGASPAQGFATTICEGKTATVLDLRRGDEVMYVEVRDDGSVEREYAGLAGNSCQAVDADLVHTLAAAGIALETTYEDRHDGRNDGLRLLVAASHRDPMCPARGGALNADERRVRRRADAAPASRRRVSGGAA
ncbi:MAG: hypothetical protein IPJ14_13830 [Kineosporiaceae bacterium]|nr:hypothetical protein [Kineosporiaceae bacterium]MBK7623703.1 hypothetical protein [Kineosporiaceae bacterium]MBK8078048.1 hypothetical protein [Kineosporiaceae bacterium]